MVTWYTAAFWKPQSIAAFLAHCAEVEAPDYWLLQLLAPEAAHGSVSTWHVSVRLRRAWEAGRGSDL